MPLISYVQQILFIPNELPTHSTEHHYIGASYSSPLLLVSMQNVFFRSNELDRLCDSINESFYRFSRRNNFLLADYGHHYNVN